MEERTFDWSEKREHLVAGCLNEKMRLEIGNVQIELLRKGRRWTEIVD